MIKSVTMSMLSNAKKSNEGPGSDPGGIVRSVNFTSVADNKTKSTEFSYVFIPILFSVETV